MNGALNHDDMDADPERAELAAQDRFDRQRAAQLRAHPNPADPDYPGDDDEETEVTEKTPLELAAKAAKSAGLDIEYDEESGKAYDSQAMRWDPRDYDGDALRLAVALGACVSQWPRHSTPEVMVGYKTPDGDGHNWLESYGNDPYAATRLAIFNAAVEIGGAL